MLQPLFHIRQYAEHRAHRVPARRILPVNSSSTSLPSLLRRTQRSPTSFQYPPSSSSESTSSLPLAPLGSINNPILVDDSDDDSFCNYPNYPDTQELPAENIRCPRCGLNGHLGINCRTKLCERCRLPGHTHFDCKQIVCRWWEKTGHFIEDCPELG